MEPNLEERYRRAHRERRQKRQKAQREFYGVVITLACIVTMVILGLG